jgi:hypothetical protein
LWLEVGTLILEETLVSVVLFVIENNLSQQPNSHPDFYLQVTLENVAVRF